MPNGAVDKTPKSFDLTTCEGGVVKLKRMSYGESVQRRAMMKLSFASDGKSDSFAGEIAMASVDIQVFEFSACVVEHNITDGEDGPVLNLETKGGLDKLDPQIGGEIEDLISKMNDFNADSAAEAKN